MTIATKAWLGAAVGALLVAACAVTAGQTDVDITPIGATEPIPATLLKPDGDGPFPAVVMMHDCSGIRAGSSGAP
jgi:dienelactone hydrolase